MRLNTLLRAAAFASRFERPVRAVLRAVLEPRKPRHRLLRVVLGLVGVVVLAALLVVGVVAGAAMIIGGLAWRLVQRPTQPARPIAPQGRRVFDGDYRVVGRPLISR